jgi:hypothetical protein
MNPIARHDRRKPVAIVTGGRRVGNELATVGGARL